MDKEIEKFTKERGINLTEEQKEQTKEIVRTMIDAGETTNLKKLSPIIDKLLVCDLETAYAVIVLMPIKSLDCFVGCADNRFDMAVNKVLEFLRRKKEKDSINIWLGSGI